MADAQRQLSFAMSEDADDAEQAVASVNESVESTASTPTAQAAAVLPESLEGQTVYVIDSHSLIYQVFHAMPALSSPSGQQVGAVHGFIRDVLDIIENKQPNYLFCAFDYPKEITFRQDLYEQYKAHRESMPEDLRPQIANIHRMLAALGVPVLQMQGYEADDILATIARLTDERGGTCVVVTSDKDCRQLITDHVKLYNIRKQEV